MASLTEILAYVVPALEVDSFADSAMNGLQIEGRPQIRRIAAAVDAGHSVIKAAVEWDADLLIVHHGIFWGKSFPVTGSMRDTFSLALGHGLSLLGLHLPLDAHPVYGNNALLAQRLELTELEPAAYHGGRAIGWIGRNSKQLRREALSAKLSELDGSRPPLTELMFGPEVPQRVCVVSGSAAEQLFNFQQEKFDTLISGEPKQFAYHFCRDNGLNAIFAGHYATETVGVKALAADLAARFQIEWKFLDQPTGI